MKSGPTPKHESSEYLEFIIERQQAIGRAPSIREMAAHFGVCEFTARYHRRRLADTGKVKIIPYQQHGIRVI